MLQPTKLSLTLLMTACLAGCGPWLPNEYHRVVSPCIPMAGIMGFDGEQALGLLLAADFKNKDKNTDGVLTQAEAVAKAVKPNMIDAELFATIDSARQGKVSLEQVKQAASTLYKWASFYRARFLARYDQNNDGQLIFAEVPKTLKLTDAVYKLADDNADGGLNADEFLNLVLAQNASSDCVPEANRLPSGATTAAVRQPVRPVPARRF